MSGTTSQRADEAAHPESFARRLYDPSFVGRVHSASRSVFPPLLAPEQDTLIDEALLRAYEKRDLFKGSTDRDLLGWVLKILRNLTRDRLRRKKDEPFQVAMPRELPDRRSRPSARPASEILTPASVLQVRELLERLPSQDRDLLHLRLGMDLSLRETAEYLKRDGQRPSVGAVKMRLSRVRRKILDWASPFE